MLKTNALPYMTQTVTFRIKKVIMPKNPAKFRTDTVLFVL